MNHRTTDGVQTDTCNNAIDLAAAELEACCCKKRKPKTRRGPRADTFVRLGEEALELADSKDWERFTARHLVALWVKSHAHIYGIDPSSELAGKIGLAAVSAARALVDKQFGGDFSKAVKFLQWTWYRERDREAFRRKNHSSGSRVSWRFQFSPALVNDYRLDLARHAELGPCAA